MAEINNSGVLGTAAQNAYEIVSPIINEGLPLVVIAQNKWQALGELFFKREIKEEGGTAYLNYVFKSGVGGNRTFQRVWTNANCAIEWRELTVEPIHTTVNATANNAATLTVANIADLRGVGANTRLIVQRPTGLVFVTVASIAGNVITLEAGQTITASVGDKVYRGVYGRGSSCTAAIDNQYTVRQPKKYESYFRKLNVTLSFQTCDLSVDRFVNYMDKANGAQVYVDALNHAVLEGFMTEFKHAVYFDRNLAAGNVVNANGAAETYGLITHIQKAQENSPSAGNLMYDYSSCCDNGVDEDDNPIPATKQNTLNMIGSFLDTVLDAHESGLYDTGVVTVACNAAQLREIMKLQGAFAEYTGVTVYHETSGHEALSVGMDIVKIKYGPVTIEFLYEETFDEMAFPFHVILPKNQIALYQRKYTAVNSDMKVTEQINGFIDAGIPYLKFKDRTEYVTNGMGDCFVFVGEFEFAVVFAGVDKGAYRVGMNLASCVAGCDVQSATPVSTLLVGEGIPN